MIRLPLAALFLGLGALAIMAGTEIKRLEPLKLAGIYGSGGVTMGFGIVVLTEGRRRD